MIGNDIVCPWNNWQRCFETRCPYYRVVETIDSITVGHCSRADHEDGT